MKFENLFLSTRSDGRVYGSATFSNDIGEIKLNLDPELAAKVLAVCASALVESSAIAAQEMTAKVFDAIAPALEIPAPPEPDQGGDQK